MVDFRLFSIDVLFHLEILSVYILHFPVADKLAHKYMINNYKILTIFY